MNNMKELILEKIDKVVKRTMKMDLPWDWSAGVAFYGIVRAWEVTKNEEYIEFLKNWTDEYIGTGIPRMTVNALSVGYTLMALYEHTKDEKYLDIIKGQLVFLENEAIRFGEGVLQHTVSQDYDFPEQAWADTLFMAGLFMIKAGKLLENHTYTQDGFHQFYWHIRYLQSRKNNLFYHAWDNINANNMSDIHWARANGWCAVTMSEALKLTDAFDPMFIELQDSLRDQLSSMVRLQAEDGLWHTVIDDPSSYTETSSSCAIATALVNYIRLTSAVLYKKYVDKAAEGLLSRIDEDGMVQGVSGGTAVMKDRDGYKNIPHERIQGWGQGLALTFLAELYAGL